MTTTWMVLGHGTDGGTRRKLGDLSGTPVKPKQLWASTVVAATYSACLHPMERTGLSTLVRCRRSSQVRQRSVIQTHASTGCPPAPGAGDILNHVNILLSKV